MLIICGCSKPATEQAVSSFSYSTYKDIPGVTQDEINAIESLKEKRDSFTVAMCHGTEAFSISSDNGHDYLQVSSQKIIGFSALLCEWISELFGIRFVPKIYRFNEILTGINSHEIDFTGSLTITSERRQTHYMAGPIVLHTLKYYRLKDSTPLAEIQRPVFALLRDSVVTDAVYLGLGDTFDPIFIDDVDMAYDLIKSGKVDAFINETDAEGIFIIYDDIEASDFLPVYLIPIGFTTQNPDLAPIISVFQKALDNGGTEHLEELSHEGYNDFRRAILFSRLTDDELDFIHYKKTIPYVTQYRNYPMSFYNEREKEWQGIAFDIIDEIRELTGLSFVRAHNDEFVNWPDLLAMVEKGEASFVTELIRTEERKDKYIWLDTSLASVFLTLASRTDLQAVHLNEVVKYRTGVVKNAAQTEVFKRWFPGHEKIIEYSDTREAFGALGKGEIDLVMTDTGNLLIMTNYLELTGFKANIVFNEYSQDSSFGLNKNEETLRSIMDKALELTDINIITENWKNRTFDYRYKLIEAQRPWLIGASILFLCLIILLFIFFQRKKSEGRRLEELVQVRTAQLQEANTAKSKFLATMSHEIRTPMNVILGVTDSMLSTQDLQNNIKEAFNKIFDSGHLLLSIINDILDLSKIESGKFEIIPAKYETLSLINDTINMNVMKIGSKQIQFKLEVDENIPLYLFGDELRIKQILNNLLSNAFKYTPSGKVILSFAAEHKTDDETVLFIMKVSDTGQGMSPEQISKLFDEYARFNLEANRATVGTGLGMPITRNLVKMMNGEITVDSAPDKGSVFTVSIPQKKIDSVLLGKEAAANLENFNVSNVNRDKKINITRELMPYGKVLVVDDIPSNLDVAKLLLNPYQLQIDTAGGGQEALDIIKSGKEYDVIFMDHMMPNMDGMETTKKIREYGYKKTIIALTANAVAGQKELFLENGFDSFISKPIDIRQMNDILNRYVRKKDKESKQEAISLQEENNIDINIQGVNSQLGLSLYGGNSDSYISILRSFSVNALSTIENLRNVSLDTLQQYAISVHGLKGICASIGAEKIRSDAEKLEKAAKAGNIDQVLAQNESLVKEAQNLVSAVQAWLAENDTNLPDLENKTTEERKKIIVVDDSEINLLVCKTILKPYFSVFTVPSAAKMFEVIKNVKPDMILLDIEMPEMNGYEVAEKLKTEYNDIPFIFLSGNMDDENKQKGFDLGALDYFPKPFNSDTLLERLKRHLA